MLSIIGGDDAETFVELFAGVAVMPGFLLSCSDRCCRLCLYVLFYRYRICYGLQCTLQGAFEVAGAEAFVSQTD